MSAAPARASHALLSTAALAWVLACLRLGYVNATVPSAARVVRFRVESVSEPSSADRGSRTRRSSVPWVGRPPSCHGSALASGEAVWQICYDSPPGDGHQTTFLARFDLAHGSAALRALRRDTGPVLRGAARRANGDLAILVGDDVYLARSRTGDVELLGSVVQSRGIAWRGDRLDVVNGGEIRTWDGNVWTTRAVSALAADAASRTLLEFAYVERDAWRFVYLRWPRTASPGPVAVDIVEVGDSDAPRTVQTLALSGPWIMRLFATDFFLTTPLLDGSAGGMMRFASGAPAVFERTSAGWRAPSMPARFGGTHRPTYDYALLGERLEPILVLERAHGSAVRLGDRWIQLVETGRVASLHDLAGRRGAPLTTAFWLPFAKVLPAGGGRSWVMGGLGENYLQIDGSLNRTDPLSFRERIARLFENDRAKRNSDFYYQMAGFKRAAVPFILLFFPLVVAPATLAFRRLRGVARWLSGAYVAGVVVFASTFIALTGTFYS